MIFVRSEPPTMPMLTCFRSSSMNAVISSVTTCRGTHAAMLRVQHRHLARTGAERSGESSDLARRGERAVHVEQREDLAALGHGCASSGRFAPVLVRLERV